MGKISARLITIEGGDGAGKTTFVPIIKKRIEEDGFEVVMTKEPGGTLLGEKLREMIMENEMDALSETMLLFAARAKHLAEVIRPALEAGKWVICDRFSDSTMAYQSMGKGVPEGTIRALQDVVHGDISPGLTFVFDVPLHVSRQRIAARGKELNKFEAEDDDFKERVAMGYKSMVRRDPKRCKLIDSSRPMDDITDQVMSELERFMERARGVSD